MRTRSGAKMKPAQGGGNVARKSRSSMPLKPPRGVRDGRTRAGCKESRVTQDGSRERAEDRGITGQCFTEQLRARARSRLRRVSPENGRESIISVRETILPAAVFALERRRLVATLDCTCATTRSRSVRRSVLPHRDAPQSQVGYRHHQLRYAADEEASKGR